MLVSNPVKPIQVAAIRVDASITMGTGHVMRCLALADLLHTRGVRSHFISRAHPGNMIAAIRLRGFEVIELPAGPTDFRPVPQPDAPLPVHAGWLGCDWRGDAGETLRAVQTITPDLLVIDHYAIDMRWEKVLRPHVRQMMVVEDLADRKHECDFLLDQNWFGGQTANRYEGLIPEACVRMLGPGYALLKPEYSALRAVMPPRDGEVRRVLVFLGGSDPADTTGKVLNALGRPDLVHLVVDVVQGVNHPNPQGLALKVAGRPATHLHRGLPTLAGWMARADLMISGGGSTTWERMCLGLPAVVISIADNQTATNEAMAAAGYIDFLGECSRVGADAIAGAVRRCMDAPQRLKRMSRMSQDLVPGTGAGRVCDRVLG
jgi:UDP-2,4-diacetamido-2,4,6-trideoxy-beta-L-altropyranose hydrolase